MDIKALQILVQQYPKIRCLYCEHIKQEERLPPPVGYITYCVIGKIMPGCGRNFNPREGGDLVPA